MEVPGDLPELIARMGELEEGPLEEAPVVRLEVDLPSIPEDPPVELQEVGVGEPPLGVAVGGPGVAEVDVDALHLAGGEVVGQPGHVGVDEEHILQLHGLGPLHGHHHGVGDPLHRHKEHLWLPLGGLTGEAALAAAQLQAQLAPRGEPLPPPAPPELRVLHLIGRAPLHPGDQIGLFPHTHKGSFLLGSSSQGTVYHTFFPMSNLFLVFPAGRQYDRDRPIFRVWKQLKLTRRIRRRMT